MGSNSKDHFHLYILQNYIAGGKELNFESEMGLKVEGMSKKIINKNKKINKNTKNTRLAQKPRPLFENPKVR